MSDLSYSVYMTEISSDRLERTSPAMTAAGMGEKALVETLRQPETISPIQRVIDYVDRVAIFAAGKSLDTAMSATRKCIEGQKQLVVTANINEWDPHKPDNLMHVLKVDYPGGIEDCISVGSDGYFTHVFGDDTYSLDDFSDEEQKVLVDAFFIRYQLDALALNSEQWQPER